jgi:hypothetical protein
MLDCNKDCPRQAIAFYIYIYIYISSRSKIHRTYGMTRPLVLREDHDAFSDIAATFEKLAQTVFILENNVLYIYIYIYIYIFAWFEGCI